MDSCKTIWNARYEKIRLQKEKQGEDPWLSEWLNLIPHGQSKRALDIGCGAGFNAKLLLENGFEVHAMDFSEKALALCQRNIPEAHRILADIREGLPFARDSFELVVADLSLHYFSMAVTASALGNVADTLVPGGLFIARFNSTNDVNYGALEGIPIAGEDNLFLVDGIQKRFFKRDCFHTLLGQQWRIASLTEKSTCRFGSRKVFWEIICIRRA